MNENTKISVSKEIESMAKYLIDQKINKNKNQKKINNIQTPKDSLSVLLYELNDNDKEIKKNINSVKKPKIKTKENYKTKETSKESLMDKNINKEIIKNEYCVKHKFESTGKLKEKIISDSLLEIEDDYEEEIKEKFFNYFKIIYTEILKEWKNQNEFNLLAKQLLSYYYIGFCFKNEFEIFVNIFNNDEIDKFFIYQIYLFISVLYLEEKNYLNKITVRNFTISFEYSFQNFQILISSPNNKIEDKDFNIFKSRNKIIKSIVQTLNFQNFNLFDDIKNLLEYLKKNETLTQILNNLEEKSQMIQNEDN